ncbi:glutathione S-transferase T1-like isoform X1 [Apium graveolens]|uniref:glutathione S-transferase T1-like isoform X1 n=1 Tax=Apium graveolens TaxID=4045 RepID=UPI003D7B7908
MGLNLKRLMFLVPRVSSLLLNIKPCNSYLSRLFISWSCRPLKKAKIHSMLDWHQSNLRQGEVGYVPGNFQPSISDLSLVCEIMQLQLVPESDRNRILSPFKKVLQWIEDIRNATNPYFDQLHSFILELEAVLTVDSSVVVKEVTKQSHAVLSKL